MMRPAKAQEFYLSIRRKQIDEIFKRSRRQAYNNASGQINGVQIAEQVSIFKTILHELDISMSNLDYFSLLQNLKSLKKQLRNSSNYLIKNAAKKENKLLQKIITIFSLLLESNLNPYQQEPIFHKGVAILQIILGGEQIKEERMLGCQTLQIIRRMLCIPMQHTQKQLSNLFNFLGNCVCQSKILSNQFINLELHIETLKLFLAIGISPKSQLTRSFVFMVRCLFDQISSTSNFSTLQLETLSSIACGSTAHHLASFNNQNQEVLLDGIQLLNKLADFKILNIRSDKIPYEDMIDLLTLTQCPLQLKKQILFFIDTIIVLDDSLVTSYLVKEQQLLIKIWGVDKEIKYIVFNIYSNLAIEKIYKDQLRHYLTPLRLELMFNKQSKQILTFNFEVLSKIEQSFIQILQSMEESNIEQINILVINIWVHLLRAGNKITSF